ncbi:PEP/pyruvate-binding domain-containing protein [Ruminococcus sp.]|uniref:PEP/pyruvate-binding domain-containing protein n=1 Tax=Ruminococcus sp. TaxID=41978 RepID=UPI0025F39E87|nr:PEP/pyruvate-binding domain-containing protein [Ruminococcus sp.]MBQ8966886.1 hypothetical protein [Ruminococcus sp.]
MIVDNSNFRSCETGAKARRLFDMAENGLNVPRFFCVQSPEDIAAAKADTEGLYSVRSSAHCEDGREFSFAGQFDTYLNVKGSDLEYYVRKCLDSRASAEAYAANTGAAADIGMTVIVQQMIQAELSGVLFTSNPQGILSEAVIAVGRGTGNNVVEDRTDVTQYYYDMHDDKFCYERQGDSPLLSEKLLADLIAAARRINEVFGERQDIEFAIKDDEVFILQSRPITTLDASNPTVLDSSNISESYPGISSPLTISFVKEVYYMVFRSSVRRTTKNDGTAERIDASLHSMTDSVNGRIYYRISNWYDVISLLPFSKKIIPVWQEMLGVQDKQVSRTGDKVSGLTKMRVMISFFQLLFTNCKKMEKLEAYFDGVYKDYSEKISNTSDPAKLTKFYSELCDALAGEWDITLANDMYTFIFTGLLKKRLVKKYGEKGAELTNKYIAGSKGIKSMEPVRKLYEMKKRFEEKGLLTKLAEVSSAEDLAGLTKAFPEGGKLIEDYIADYGDRCPEELKLETQTYRVAPWRLCGNIAAASPVREDTGGEQVKGFMTKAFAKRAAAGIRLRESSRMSRGRIFGLMRQIVRSCGEAFVSQQRLTNTEDVFYLTMEELFSAAENTALPLMETVTSRRKKWAGFKKLPLYTRLVFADDPFDKVLTDFGTGSSASGELSGIPCSEGIAEGEVVLVEQPSPDIDTKGRIIAARMTDPGWVFMITGAAGILSEKGSLLSHTAIISRELGKPSVVGVRDLFDKLHNGDYIRINGSTGEINILRRKQANPQ